VRTPRAIAALLAATLLAHAPGAAAQVMLGPCGNVVCGGPLGQYVGQFAFVTGVLMPRSAGIGFTGGLGHSYPFGLETSLNVPLTVDDPDAVNRGIMTLAGRARLHRAPLGGDRGPLLDVVLRVGIAGVFGPFLVNGAVVGPSFELGFGMFALVLRTSLVVTSAPRSSATPLALDVLPFVELGLGAIPPAQR
jgi:hypothetical protein